MDSHACDWSPQWYTLVTSLILGVGIGCLAQPQLVVRFMMVESTKQLNRGVLIGCVFLIVTVGAIYHVGALSNLFFLKTEGVVASEASRIWIRLSRCLSTGQCRNGSVPFSCSVSCRQVCLRSAPSSTRWELLSGQTYS